MQFNKSNHKMKEVAQFWMKTNTKINNIKNNKI